MKFIKLSTLILAISIFIGCNTISGTGTGAVLGGLAGGGIGAAIDGGDGALAGALIGAGVGGATGAYVGHQNEEKSRQNGSETDFWGNERL